MAMNFMVNSSILGLLCTSRNTEREKSGSREGRTGDEGGR